MTLLINEQRDKLESEVAIGQRAQRAFDLYLKGFFEENYRELYTAFVSCTDDNDAMSIRRLTQATKELHMTLERDIESGKMAAVQLEQLSKEGKG